MIETRIIQSRFLGGDVKIRIITSTLRTFDSVMILLHGKKSCDEDDTMIEMMIERLKLEALCEKYHIMIVIPNMRNCYYISTKDYQCEQFISKELPEYLEGYNKEVLKAEKLLGGISMGGYGAMLIGANTDVFSQVISISGSFIENDILIGNPEVWGSRRPREDSAKGSFLYYFLPLEELAHSCYKSAEAALESLKGKEERPELYFTCGTKDWLYARNLTLLKKLKENHIKYHYYEIPKGQHDSSCFREGLWKFMEERKNLRG